MKNNSRWMHGVFLFFIILVLGLALPQLRSGEPKADPQGQERGRGPGNHHPTPRLLSDLEIKTEGSDERETDVRGRANDARQQWAFVAIKVIRNDEMVCLIRDDQVPAKPFVVARKQKVGIGNLDGYRIFPM